jgi:four helix bundle protein
MSRMGVRSLDDLHIYQEALEAADAVSAILSKEPFRRDPKFRAELAESAERVAAFIGDGFGQKPDARVEQLFGAARRACGNVRLRLAVARGRHYITEADCASAGARYDRIGKQLTRLLQELRERLP